jgi:hypothetical protein
MGDTLNIITSLKNLEFSDDLLLKFTSVLSKSELAIRACGLSDYVTLSFTYPKNQYMVKLNEQNPWYSDGYHIGFTHENSGQTADTTYVIFPSRGNLHLKWDDLTIIWNDDTIKYHHSLHPTGHTCKLCSLLRS